VTQPDFDYSILNAVAHRCWPMPDAPWVMRQTWHDLLFAHWPVDPRVLVGRVPPPLELDLFDGAAWLGIVPFHMTNVAPRAVPALPWISAFPELNVRTYVRMNDRPGVYFFSLDAGNPIAVATARTLFNLPYYTASMNVDAGGRSIRYRSRRSGEHGDAAFGAQYEPTGSAAPASAGSLDYFVTERYCLYTVDRAHEAHRLEIHHRPWPLQPAAATFYANTMAAVHGIALPPQPPLLHFVKRLDMVAWLPTRIVTRATTDRQHM